MTPKAIVSLPRVSTRGIAQPFSHAHTHSVSLSVSLSLSFFPSPPPSFFSSLSHTHTQTLSLSRSLALPPSSASGEGYHGNDAKSDGLAAAREHQGDRHMLPLERERLRAHCLLARRNLWGAKNVGGRAKRLQEKRVGEEAELFLQGKVQHSAPCHQPSSSGRKVTLHGMVREVRERKTGRGGDPTSERGTTACNLGPLPPEDCIYIDTYRYSYIYIYLYL